MVKQGAPRVPLSALNVPRPDSHGLKTADRRIRSRLMGRPPAFRVQLLSLRVQLLSLRVQLPPIQRIEGNRPHLIDEGKRPRGQSDITFCGFWTTARGFWSLLHESLIAGPACGIRRDSAVFNDFIRFRGHSDL